MPEAFALGGPLMPMLGIGVSSRGAELGIYAEAGRTGEPASLVCRNRPALLNTLVFRFMPPDSLSLLRLRQQQNNKRANAATAAITPTVTPATAPLERPDCAWWKSAVPPEAAAVSEGVDVM